MEPKGSSALLSLLLVLLLMGRGWAWVLKTETRFLGPLSLRPGEIFNQFLDLPMPNQVRRGTRKSSGPYTDTHGRFGSSCAIFNFQGPSPVPDSVPTHQASAVGLVSFHADMVHADKVREVG